MNKLVKGNLVRGLPSKIFENDHSCVACQKGKKYKASYKTKLVNSIRKPLHMLHMNLFGPTNVKSLMKKSYCLVVTNDFSRFSWVFFLDTKDETSRILKTFIIGIENQLDYKVKVIRCDNRTEFKNNVMNQFCEMKGIKREFSVARIPHQNGVDERKNKTLIETARTIPEWLFDVDSLTMSMNYVLVVAGHQTNDIAGNRDNIVAGQAKKEKVHEQEYILIPLCTTDPLISQDPKDINVDAGNKAIEVDESKAFNKDEDDLEDPYKQGRKIAQIDKDEGITLVQIDAKIQGRTSADTEILLDQEEPIELVEDLGSGEKGEKEISTANVPVSTASAILEDSTAGPSSSTVDVFEDEMMTIAESLVSIRRTRPRKTLVVIHDPEEEQKRIVQADAELVQRLHEEELAKLERVQKEKAAQEEASKAYINEELDDIQAMIEAYEQIAARIQSKEQEKYIIEEKERIEKKDDFSIKVAGSSGKKTLARKRAGKKQSKESSKKQKLEEDIDAEEDELRASIDIVSRDDIAINVESLATKYPIVDWKKHVLTENMIQDVMDLHRLIQERYDTTSPEEYDLLLWGDLKILFEPDEDDEIWKDQQDYNLISWRLYDSCGVHVLLMNTRIAIHMFI
nr:putative ribonuclease H-like domain-containing protein [Tanacetum cinerariifolium]